MDITINETKKPKKKKKKKFRPLFIISTGFFISLIIALIGGYIIFRSLVYLRERGETLPFVTIPIPEDKTLMIAVGILAFLGFMGMRIARLQTPVLNDFFDSDANPLLILITYLFFMANIFLIIFLPPYIYACAGTFEYRYTDVDRIVASVDEPKTIESILPFEEPKQFNFYTINYTYYGKEYTVKTSSLKEFEKGDEVTMTLYHFRPEKCAIKNAPNLYGDDTFNLMMTVIVLLVLPTEIWRFYFLGSATEGLDSHPSRMDPSDD